jgi:hypothetical protein
MARFLSSYDADGQEGPLPMPEGFPLPSDYNLKGGKNLKGATQDSLASPNATTA